MTKNLARSIYRSQEQQIECVVKGVIPNWLNGTLFRNGPGRFRFGDKVYKHLFDGMACINKFEIKGGIVKYSNNLLESKVYQKTLKTNVLSPMLGTLDPCVKYLDRLKFLFKPRDSDDNDNCNINVVPFSNNQLYAMTESSTFLKLDPKKLNILNQITLAKYIKPTKNLIAHPHRDEDGSWISMGMCSGGKKLSYDIIKFENTNSNDIRENVKLLAQIPSSHKSALSYFHSFALTKNYIVFLEQSLILDFKKVFMSVMTSKPIIKGFNIQPDFKTKIHIVDRKSLQILPQKFYTDPQFTFHHINAYETNETNPDKPFIYVDICSYDPNTFDFENFNYNENDEDQLHKFSLKCKSRPRRIQIPLNEKKSNNEGIYCEIRNISDGIHMELPTVNYPKYNGRKYNFAYGIGLQKHPYSIVKLNVNNFNDHKFANIQTSNRVVLPSEPIFVENPNAQSEDDGVLLSIVLGDKFDSLIVLDAKTLEQIACAELPADVKATYTLHGFFADKKIFGKLN